MAKSAGEAGLTVDGTVKSMMELQQKGGLISSKVLPIFAKNMSKAAQANGGLEKAMLSNRVAMNRFMFSVQEAANVVFTSGLSKGLTEFFNAAATSVVELKPLWQSLGTVFGSVFSILSKGIKAVTPTLKAFGEVLKSITTAMGESYAWILTTTTAAGVLFGVISKVGGAKLFAMKTLPILAQITAMLAAIQEVAFWAEEIDNLLFSRNKRGLLYDSATGKTNIGGGYIEGMKSAISRSPTGALATFLSELPSKTLQGAGNIWGQGMQNSLDFMGVKHTVPTLNLTISADAQKLGLEVFKSPAATSTIDSRIQQNMQ